MNYQYSEGENLYENSAVKQRIFEKQLEIQAETVKAFQVGQVRINEAGVKTQITEAMRVEGYEKRLRLREEAKERARAVVEVLDVDDKGQLLVLSKNTSVVARPRSITNMSRPKISILRSTNPFEPPCYKLACEVANKEICVFLASDKIGKGNYLLNKLVSRGIYFEIQQNKIKPLLLQLLGRLIENCTAEELVPETEGWIKLDNGKYRFFSEGNMTWIKIRELTK